MLKKENKKNVNSTCHCEEHSATKQSIVRHPELVYHLRCHHGSVSQKGRSMVEMLGALTIIGILSVAGIAAYSTTMKKYKANELLNEASKKAVVIAAQIASGRTPSLDEFGDTRYGLVDTGLMDKFAITIDNVDKDTCQSIKNIITDKTVVRYIALKDTPQTKITTCDEGNAHYALVFNKDLSNTIKASDYNGDQLACEADSSRLYCVGSGICVLSTENCPVTGPSCPSGSGADNSVWTGGEFTVSVGEESITCYCTDGESYQSGECASIPASCSNYTSNVCGIGYYCKPTGRVKNYNAGTGACTKISTENNNEGIKSLGGYWISSETMDWFSANSWCIGKGTDGLLPLTALDITDTSDNSSLTRCYFPGNADYVTQTGYANGSFTNEESACKASDGTTMTPDNDYANYWATLRDQIGVEKYWMKNALSQLGQALLLDVGRIGQDSRSQKKYGLCNK